MTTTEPRAFAAALAGLPGMGPRRLTAILARWSPEEAWDHVRAGRLPALQAALPEDAAVSQGLPRAWTDAATHLDPAERHEAHHAAGVQVLLTTDPGYPPVLAADAEPPAVLFATGGLDALDARRVAIVGTRRCTGVGAGMARELGRELAASGVVVISGLALGIDGAAHRGVLDARASHPESAPPVGVVGSGLDVVYPARNRELWHGVGATGLLLSEAPLGCRPAGWRFPARNRVIAALSELVVVVESHATGGSLHTVTEAIERDIQVMAVPGSVRSPAAAGTNQLLADGCHPVRDPGDVLVALGLSTGSRRRPVEHRPAPSGAGEGVLRAFDWEPATLEHLAVRTGLALPALALELEGLVRDGWVQVDGAWYERVAAA